MNIVARFRLPSLAVLAGAVLVATVSVLAQSATTPSPASHARAAAAIPLAAMTPEAPVPRGPDDWRRTLALSPDGRLFVTVDADRHVRLWELESGKAVADLPLGTIAAVFSPDSRVVACELPSRPRRWQIIDSAEGKPLGESLALPGDELGGPEALTFSPDGKFVVAPTGLAETAAIALWDAASGKFIGTQSVTEILGAVAIAFSADSRQLVTAGGQGAAIVWSVPELKRLQTLKTGDSVSTAAAFSPDGRIVVVGGHRIFPPQALRAGMEPKLPTARMLDVASGKILFDLKIFPDPGQTIRQICFADDGNALITSDEKAVQAFSARDGRLLAHLPGACCPVAISPDGHFIAGALVPDLGVWDAANLRLSQTIPNARVAGGLSMESQGNVPLVFGVSGRIATRRSDAVAAWELPAGRLIAERRATQPMPVAPAVATH